MPVEVQFVGGLIRQTFSGEVSAVDLQDLAKQVLALEAGLPRAPDRIADLSAVTSVAADFLAIDQLARKRVASPPRNPTRNAIVAPTPMLFGVARMFQTLNTAAGVEVRIFRDRASAEAWLLPPAS